LLTQQILNFFTPQRGVTRLCCLHCAV